MDQLETALRDLHNVVRDFAQLNDAQQSLHLLTASAMKDPDLYTYLDWDHVVSLFEVIDAQSLAILSRLTQLAAQVDAVLADVSTDNLEAFKERLAAVRQHGAVFTERFNAALAQLSATVGVDWPL